MRRKPAPIKSIYNGAMFFQQAEYSIRCEWGPEGLNALADTDALVLIDVFSFTTCVDLAVGHGCSVYPYRWKDETSTKFAQARHALLATASRDDVAGFSLAPSSMLRLPPGSAVVLPSPNGARLSLLTGKTPTFAACLRNATSVAQAAAALGKRISVISAGERWKSDSSLRPSLEDALGAGAVIHALTGDKSPEAQAAEALFVHFLDRLESILGACSSGVEAAARGSRADVRLAADWNASSAVPFLKDGAYQEYSCKRT